MVFFMVCKKSILWSPMNFVAIYIPGRKKDKKEKTVAPKGTGDLPSGMGVAQKKGLDDISRSPQEYYPY
ncbi:hypothetical protein MY10362_005005 [Beauveria mimosiformis]